MNSEPDEIRNNEFTTKDLKKISEWLKVDENFIRRPVRASIVEKLSTELKNLGHFNAAISIHENTKTNKCYVIDGQHRLKAIVNVLSENPNMVIPQRIDIFKNRSESDQIDLYRSLAISATQSINDRLLVQLQESKIYSYVMGIPDNPRLKIITTTGKVFPKIMSLSFQRIVRAVYRAKRNLFLGGVNTEELIIDAKNWDEKEISLLEDGLVSFKKLHLGELEPWCNPCFRSEAYLTVFFYLRSEWLARGFDAGKFDEEMSKVFSHSKPNAVSRFTMEFSRTSSIVKLGRKSYEFIVVEFNRKITNSKNRFKSIEALREELKMAELEGEENGN